MTEVSSKLRAARERAGLTIADVAAGTRIRAASLEAIERGDFAALPGQFYARAFVRTYASYLGLPLQEIVDEYEAEAPRTAPVPSSPPAWQSSARRASSQFVAAATSTGVVIALVVGLLALAVARHRSDGPPATEPGAVATTGAVPSAPVGSSGTSAAAAPVVAAGATAPAPQALVIEIQAAGPMWVTGAADGKRVLYRLLAPGERVSIKAQDSLAFRVGDASAFTYSINGVPGKPIGAAGEVRDIEITRANVSTFTR